MPEGRGVSRWTAATTALVAAWLVAAPVDVAMAQPVDPDTATRFARPSSVPHPAGNPPSPEAIALGRRLFAGPALSRSGTIACATCHDPKLAFADGVAISRAGATGLALRRHTPSLWNLAWAPRLYWDGRASSLEDQARFPLSHPDEMASSPDEAASRLAGDAGYLSAFRAAFGDDATPTGERLLAAIAAFERTLVSPPTRFDQWIAGRADALSSAERRGFGLFTGKAGCVNCHSGFAFTDHAFHDIGLPGADRGRGAHIDLVPLQFAFKTPTLRELSWTAPYMHDGSIETLEAIVRHYERGGIRRPSRSRDMPAPFTLTITQRADLVAFLEALSSDRPPAPSTEAWIGSAAPAVPIPLVGTLVVSQREKQFAPAAIRVRAGEAITIRNNDTRTHNVTIAGPDVQFNSGAQEPGQSVRLTLTRPGRHDAHCAIHPSMQLHIEVE